MGFAESFAECMQGAGVNLDPSAIQDESSFGEAINYVKSWFESLPAEAKQGFDDATATGEPAAQFLVEANVAPSLPGVMQAFDQASGVPLSSLLDWCNYCTEQAKAAGEGQTA
jgi:hypothetical protein